MHTYIHTDIARTHAHTSARATVDALLRLYEGIQDVVSRVFLQSRQLVMRYYSGIHQRLNN